MKEDNRYEKSKTISYNFSNNCNINSNRSSSKNGYSKRDQEIFLLFLQGIRYSELAETFHLSFPTIKRIIERIRSDIIKELF